MAKVCAPRHPPPGSDEPEPALEGGMQTLVPKARRPLAGRGPTSRVAGELLIPTIVLLYGLDIKIAGSLSFLISLPTMLVAFTRYSRDQSFGVIRGNRGFLVAMAVGSVAGTVLGGLLLGVVSSAILVPLLALLLVLSSWKVWSH